MLYIIGLGLNERGISQQGLEAVKKCKKIYLENYTVNFPYSVKELEKIIKKKTINADRGFVEENKIIAEAKKENVALLVYGSPLTATTHISLVQETKKNKIKLEIIYGASVLDAVAETGLQIYKFGKITSMPKWTKSFKPTSFMEVVKDNQKIFAHSLILIDIDLNLEEAISELKESAKRENVDLDKIVICSRLGTKNKKILYRNIEELKKSKIEKPYCMIIPGKLHFIEEEILEMFK
jgi:diphthine synthase